MVRIIGIVGFLLFAAFACKQSEIQEMDLSGEWNYQLDKSEIGENEKWFNAEFTEKITLPGALRDYGIGDEPDLDTDWTGSIYDSSWYFNPAMEKYRQKGNIKFPFWLTPDKHYKGMAWFQRDLVIPENWQNQELVLHLERPHWQSKVWFDSLEIGSDNSLSVPHRFVIPSEWVTSGLHRLTIRIDNAIREIDPGINSHSISDHTQGNWNGIVGEMKLLPRADVHFEKVKVSPQLANNTIKIEVQLNKALSEAKLDFEIEGKNHDHKLPRISKTWEDGKTTLSFTLPMGDDYKAWSEFAPNVYELALTLKGSSGIADFQKVPFGMREFSINDKHFEINGTPVFLRGTTECSVFPLTGYPPTDKEEWARIFEVCKSFGLNHMRFHSYCPPEAAFSAADEAGIYLQVEGPSWAKYSTSLGYGAPIDAYLMKETQRILDTYGNHPSFVMMAYGNEPSGRYVGYLENWVDHFKRYDSRFVYTGASTGRSWAIIENSDFIVRSPPRGLEWKDRQPGSLFDYRHKTENQQRPYVTFEMGQWCAFPNFNEIDKYTGALKAKNFELFREDLADHHMADLADEFLMASGKLQASCYKQEIEATLRTPNLAGFQLLSLNDFSGQGSALVGVLDAFWDEKGYLSASEFKSFCSEVVPLIRIEKYTFETNETLNAAIEIANFSGRVLENSNIEWKLTNDTGQLLKEGIFEAVSIPQGSCNEAGMLEIPLNFIEKASKLTLSVVLGDYQNSWNVWVYPTLDQNNDTNSILIAEQIGPEVKEALEQGQNVLLLAAGKVENGKDVVQYYVPAFWNTSWFRMRPPHTTGIFIQHEHAVFDDFPTDYYSDLQWWELANRQQVMNLENFPADFRPLVQPIDTWFLNRRLAMLFEARVGKGKLMVCSADLSTGLDQRPVARQLKQSIQSYMNSERFNPSEIIDYSIIEELFEKKEREGWKSYVNENP
ncbi:sugar-binding domain-containing protein [Roseimarinus sediminis]|uniref:sugar-binding domain-containing protein n=1 Tax=Roseimarinus sediminis TaxID=1610899 RepID=UPI003D230C03